MLKPEFFQPVDEPAIDFSESAPKDSFAAGTLIHDLHKGFPELEGISIALLGIPDYRGSVIEKNFRSGTAQIREKIYKLKKHYGNAGIADLGDLMPGNTLEDTYFALAEIVQELLRMKIIPVVIGGSQDLTIAQYNAYRNIDQVINIVSIDSRFDLGFPEDPSGNHTWLGKIVLQQPNYLFNFSNLGYQSYFVGPVGIDLMAKLYFDAYRVGEVRQNIAEMEPVIRGADLLSFDLSSIRQSDAPGACNPSPNGFSGEEACQAMMYAGMNDRLTGLGIYEYDESADRQGQTAHLVAQMIWYFIEGFNNRRNDLPKADNAGFMQYRVFLDSLRQDLVFLKNKTTGRWWIEVPVEGKNNRFSRHHFMPCSQRDYQQACDNEMPERYWQALQKLG